MRVVRAIGLKRHRRTVMEPLAERKGDGGEGEGAEVEGEEQETERDMKERRDLVSVILTLVVMARILSSVLLPKMGKPAVRNRIHRQMTPELPMKYLMPKQRRTKSDKKTKLKQ